MSGDSRMTEWPDGVSQEDVFDLIDAVVGSLHKNYRAFIQADDLRQELRLFAWRKREKFSEYLVREDAGLRRAGEAAFMKACHRVGEKLCRAEKARLSGYEASDEFYYSQGLIEELLTAHGQGTNTMPGRVPDRRSGSDPAEGGNMVVMMIDVTNALIRLEPAQQELLADIYGRGITVNLIARRDGVTEQAIRGRVDRAMRRMLAMLGGDGHGMR